MSCCTSATSAPASSMSPAKVRRRSCGPKRAISATHRYDGTMTTDASLPRLPQYRVWWILALTVAVASVGVAIADWFLADDWAQRAQRGDYFGGHFSVAGSIAGAILLCVAVLFQRDAVRGQTAAVAMQQEELQLQREELAATRTEMEAARRVSEGQRDLMPRQVMVASEAATISQIIEALRFRNELDIRIQELKDTPTSAEESSAHMREVARLNAQRLSIGRYMEVLTARASIDGILSPYLRDLAGLPPLQAAP